MQLTKKQKSDLEIIRQTQIQKRIKKRHYEGLEHVAIMTNHQCTFDLESSSEDTESSSEEGSSEDWRMDSAENTKYDRWVLGSYRNWNIVEVLLYAAILSLVLDTFWLFIYNSVRI